MNKITKSTNDTNKGAVFAALSVVFFGAGASLINSPFARYSCFIAGIVLIVLAGIETAKAKNR